jgi:hypothetical protein
MTFTPKSIDDHIRCLARLTGAPESFIGQVKDLFARKGISLDSEATPYLRALEDAFRREENIRATSGRAQRTVTDMQRNFAKMGRAYVRQAENLRLDKSAGKPKPGQKSAAGRTVTVRGDHRSLVTSAQREVMPLVPGPSDIQ